MEVEPLELLIVGAAICTILGFVLEVIVLVVRHKRKAREKDSR
jgi:hypothetical protein